MAFTIRNAATAGDPQASPDKVDFDIIAQGLAGEGVVSGCAVTAQGTPDMTVAVAAGTVRIAGVSVAVAGGNLTVTNNTSGNPRFDLVSITNAGVKSVVAGTPAANPVYPAGAAVAGSVVAVAAIWVPTSPVSITGTRIEDKRALVEVPSAVGGGLTLVEHATPTGTTETLDLSAGNVHRVRWDADLVLSLANVPAGLTRFFLLLYHDSSAATYTLTHWANIEWVDDAAGPFLPSGTANAEAFIEYWTFNGGSSYRAAQRGNFFP